MSFTGLLQVRGTDVTLEAPSETSGDSAVTWTTVATVKALIEGVGGHDVAPDWQSDLRMMIAYRDDVSTDMRVGWGARKFKIVSPPVADMWRKQLSIALQEAV